MKYYKYLITNLLVIKLNNKLVFTNLAINNFSI